MSWGRHGYITGSRAVCDREAGVSAGPGRSSAAQIRTLPRRFAIVTCVDYALETRNIYCQDIVNNLTLFEHGLNL
ncbi:hypothetical protein Hamer_G020988 [Homarus americanus]|uniref:Uncharacterized protein n=1 Tax=Homarus americanus TaxID=6706 RepID=A0A8J5JL41_HOMAM|nr:hypothetical protein Hamer_G020988 [Homarus americanus]